MRRSSVIVPSVLATLLACGLGLAAARRERTVLVTTRGRRPLVARVAASRPATGPSAAAKLEEG
jgi:hypothetical protein